MQKFGFGMYKLVPKRTWAMLIIEIITYDIQYRNPWNKCDNRHTNLVEQIFR